jgi:anaerobic ribonucleoside-triphosphate reductase activating protein
MEAAWSFRGGKTVAADHLLTRILADPDLEGVTFLGGEPFEQAEALAALGRGVQRAGLSVMTFTGYTREILAGAGRADWRALLAVTDLLVDGPYDQTRPDSRRPWVGSTNQRLHDLTGRYRDLLATLPQVPDRLEIRLDADGNLLVNGFATTSQIRGLLEGL